MNITEFLDTQYNEAALYMLYRNTASYVDGLKNAARKVVYTIKKRNISHPMKVSALGSAVVEAAEYLHGDASIQTTIVTAAKSAGGYNNLPVLEGIGAFGTRFNKENAAARYIFAKPAEYFDLLFRKEDDPNLALQEFEGKPIEPMYYVPTLPLILVNGSEGIGVGFSSLVFARPVANVIKATRAFIEGKKLKSEWFYPGWHDFRGTVAPDEGTRWIVKGVYERNGKKVKISEVPISWNLKPFTDNLDKLKDAGKIRSYLDFSEDDHFKFEVTLSDEEALKTSEEIEKDLGLVEPMSEILSLFDETNQIREYNDIKEIFKDYCDIKIKSLQWRIKSEIARLSKEESDLKETLKFVKENIKGTIVLKNKKKAEAEKELKEKGYTIIDKLISMPLYSLTIDKVKELEDKVKAKTAELKAMKTATPQSLWSKDIDELEVNLKKTGWL